MKTLIIALVAMLVFVGCSRSASADQQADVKIDSMGVFAETDQGLLKLETFALRDGEDSYAIGGSLNLPSVARVTAFYINLPQFVLTDENKVMWMDRQKFDEYASGVQFSHFFERHAKDLSAIITKRADGIYKVSVPEYDGSRAGVVALKVVLPSGSTDRAYLLSVPPR